MKTFHLLSFLYVFVGTLNAARILRRMPTWMRDYKMRHEVGAFQLARVSGPASKPEYKGVYGLVESDIGQSASVKLFLPSRANANASLETCFIRDRISKAYLKTTPSTVYSLSNRYLQEISPPLILSLPKFAIPWYLCWNPQVQDVANWANKHLASEKAQWEHPWEALLVRYWLSVEHAYPFPVDRAWCRLFHLNYLTHIDNARFILFTTENSSETRCGMLSLPFCDYVVVRSVATDPELIKNAVYFDDLFETLLVPSHRCREIDPFAEVSSPVLQDRDQARQDLIKALTMIRAACGEDIDEAFKDEAFAEQVIIFGANFCTILGPEAKAIALDFDPELKPHIRRFWKNF